MLFGISSKTGTMNDDNVRRVIDVAWAVRLRSCQDS